MRAEIDCWLAMLALQPCGKPHNQPRITLVWLALHLAGLTALWLLFQFPLVSAMALAALTLCALLSPQLFNSVRAHERRLSLGVLSPLLLVYLVIAVRLVLKYAFQWQLPTYAGGEPLNVVTALITTENILLAALAYIVLIYFVQAAREQAQWSRAIALTLLVLTLVWAMWEFFGHHSAGVTGSDPYAYAQMAVDWAARGTPLHEFPLFSPVVALDLPYFAGVHVGYHLPLENLRDAASVWPTGVSFFLAIAYRMLGEDGLYRVVPLFGLLSLGVLWWLARCSAPQHADLIGAFAVLLLATSFEQVNRLLVPMADVPSQFFCTLAIALALFAPRIARRNFMALIALGALAGMAFGLAYWIRHTQLLIGFALVLAVVLWEAHSRCARLAFLAVLACVALLVALPDLAYHQQVFGSVINVESEELQYFRLDALGAAIARALSEFLLPHEFGFIWPLTVIGALRMARAQFKLFAVLLTWLLAVVAIHLPYAALRLRDLLGEFPPLMIWTAWGAVTFIAARRPADVKTNERMTDDTTPIRFPTSYPVIILAIVFVLFALSLRMQTTLARTLTPHSAGFGYVLPSERAAFDAISQLTPNDAVIASTLSSGAMDLYAHRLTIRPNVWSMAQFDKFFEAMRLERRPMYLLYDSPDLRPLRDQLRASGRLEVVQQFMALTFFGDREAQAGTLYRITE